VIIARTVQQNQWNAACFHEHLADVVKSERETLPKMTDEEIRASYLLVWLGMAEPAGEA
jgi:hypothetical protein